LTNFGIHIFSYDFLKGGFWSIPGFLFSGWGWGWGWGWEEQLATPVTFFLLN